MSTRSQIIIQYYKDVLPKEKQHLTDIEEISKNVINTLFHQELMYHHFDGYLMGVGLELLEKLKTISEFDVQEIGLRGLIYFLDHGYEEEEINYQENEGMNNLHGDIEYLYYIRINNNKTIELFYKEYDFGERENDPIEKAIRNKEDLFKYFDRDNRILYRDLKEDYFKINFNN